MDLKDNKIIARSVNEEKNNLALRIIPELTSSDARLGISGSFIELNQIFEKKNAIETPNKTKILKRHKYIQLFLEFFKFIKLLLIKIAAAGIAGSQQLGSFVAERLKNIKTDINQHKENV